MWSRIFRPYTEEATGSWREICVMRSLINSTLFTKDYLGVNIKVATDPDVWVRFLSLPDFVRSSGSGTGSTQPLSTTEKLLGRKRSGFGLEKRDYGRRDPSRWPRDILYPQTLALTSPTSGGRSVDIVLSRTQATELVCFVFFVSRRMK
jgi:hypothetical protein